MKELSTEQKAKAYDEAVSKLRRFMAYGVDPLITRADVQDFFPELAESEDERIRKDIVTYLKSILSNKKYGDKFIESWISWLEKQGEPNWCHHKVDLSECSEEYRKAYYDGWNNCNMQHSQCKSESDDVIKCLINGMEFYYEDNEEATWGTEKFSMKVKDILSWLEKQGNTNKEYWRGYREGKQEILDKYTKLEKQAQKPTDNIGKPWSEEDDYNLQCCIAKVQNDIDNGRTGRNRELLTWLNSLKDRYTWKPSEGQLECLGYAIEKAEKDWSPLTNNRIYLTLKALKEQLKKLKG